MPNQQPVPTVQNHFIAGLKTEFTGLNFPENAATATSNCVYTMIGDVTRRGGINYETNFTTQSINTSSVAHSSYKWTNVGGDGQTKILVKQIGSTLYFFLQTNTTTASPLSTTLLASTVNITSFQALGNTNNTAITECQFTDGNGYLIVFHKDCDPFFCTYNSANQTVTPTVINIKTRDFVGIPEGVADNFRPNSLSAEHQYNLQNQGWTAGAPWTATIYDINKNEFAFPQGTFNLTSSLITIPIVSQTNTTSLTNGSQIQLVFWFNGTNVGTMNIVITSYVSPFTSITGNIISCSISPNWIFNYADFVGYVKLDNLTTHIDANVITASLVNTGFIQTWLTQIGNYPSNSDIWWLYKNTSNAFAPNTTITNVQQAFGPAPKGYFIMSAFRQLRSSVSGVTNLTDITTTTRPSTGCWYQGRVFYTGVNASQQATGDEPYTTWTENIYFSQIVESPTNFGNCYQTNDPTSQTFFSILPSDGGVLTIQGSGAIYKLFPLRFGLLVFAANGVWFIGGSQGMGFSANDYTIIKISSIQCVSNTSFIDVQGYPLFWNAEGIYKVIPAQQAGSAHSPDIQLDVQNMCVGTILTYYNNIPQQSIQYARGDYDPLNYIVQWVFRSTAESGISNRYAYDTILAFNTVTGAFYPYSLPTTSTSTICDIKYIQNPGGPNVPTPVLKYITLVGLNLTFSEENDTTHYVDFFSENSAGYNFTSTFTSGYNLPGQGLRKVQIPYLYLFFREPTNTACEVQSIWDFATAGASGKWSPRQLITNNIQNVAMLYRRVRLLGRGMAVQIKVTSVPGQPFDIMGWSVWNMLNQGV